MKFTIKEISDLAGVTTRTVRYYDEIELLKPASTGDNGYRYYDQDSLLRLQQILFFRELDVPLKDIHIIMSQPDFNLVAALEKHRISLQHKATRLHKLIETIDLTITNIKGESNMSAEEYFEGFDESQYQEEVKKRWGDSPQYAESQRKWAGYSKEQKKAIKAEGDRLTARMVGDDPTLSPDDLAVQAAVGEYYAYINQYFYTCEVGYLRGLADMWVEDPRFSAIYESIRPGGAEFVRDAVHIYCESHAKDV